MKFEIYIGQDKWYHWRLRAGNGEPICWSEGYTRKESCLESIRIVMGVGFSTPVFDLS